MYKFIGSGLSIYWLSSSFYPLRWLWKCRFLTMITIRTTLRHDIARYNTDDNIEGTLDETGWKSIHGDAVRPPRNTRLFSPVILQILLFMIRKSFQSLLGWGCFHRPHEALL
uniref:Transmembrane 9 superfamily member n=1 Tax=Glossina austeni TaxID=7395 RepID=A0A1A9UPT3_GLOAU